MSTRDAFLRALEENEDDITARLVYADWLDEQGEHEEADRQRKWPAAKEWLVHFCEQANQDPDERPISCRDLVERARQALESANKWGISLSCGNNMSMSEALRSNSREFWRNWSILTGIVLPPDAEEGKVSYSCAC